MFAARLSSLAMARRRCEGDKKTSDEEGLEAEPNDYMVYGQI